MQDLTIYVTPEHLGARATAQHAVRYGDELYEALRERFGDVYYVSVRQGSGDDEVPEDARDEVGTIAGDILQHGDWLGGQRP